MVVGVHDGDTLTVLAGGQNLRVRLSGIDAPEREQRHGDASRASLHELCYERMAAVVTAGKDRYGRLVGVVSCDGVAVNREQVRRGWAWVYVRYVGNGSPLYTDEREAREERRGLWEGYDPRPPWEWRSRRNDGRLREAT